jgi:hypothetical protein
MKGQTHGGKGSTPRPTNKRRFDENYENIFNKKAPENQVELDEGIHITEGDGRSGESKFREYAEGAGVQGQADQEQAVKAAAVLPNGELTSNVYDAFDKGYAQAKIDLAEKAVEQNPVAWGEPNGIGDVIDVITDDDRKHDVTQWSKSYTLPLYAHPPKREPLSDDEIKKMWLMSAIFGTNLEKAVALTRAIEKAHGISDER